MDLRDCYVLEDLFPKSFADFEERKYGILFYNIDNKDSYDSNHAVIYREKIDNIAEVLVDIVSSYKGKGIRPTIYQSALDNGYFGEIHEVLAREGFDSWLEEQKFMVLMGENSITPNEKIEVKQVNAWDESLKQIFIEAEEEWEIGVLKAAIKDPNVFLWVAYLEKKPIGYLFCTREGEICRGNYVLVSKLYRNVGAGRALCYHYVKWCRKNGIIRAFHWPDGEHPEKIYHEGGFRHVETIFAGRACLKNE